MVNKDGTISNISEEIQNNVYRVVSTLKGTGGVWGAIDKIKNETTGTTKTMTRKEWYNIFKKFK